MPARKLENPSSNRNDRHPENKRQGAFTDVFEDEPPSTLPEGAVAKAINGICQGNDFEPRNGSILFTNERFPGIPGRDGYSAHKVDDIIISDSGDIFDRDDVSNLWGWENGLFEEMTEYISSTRMRVRDDDPNSGSNSYMRGKVNLWEWYKKKELWVIQLGDDFWTANFALTEFTFVLIISKDKPSNSFSEMREFEEYAIIENSGGQYKLIIDDSPPTCYRTNSNIPTIKVDSNNADGEKDHKYRHFYAMARLDENALFRNRNTVSGADFVQILTESGLNKYYYTGNPEGEEEGDWSINNTSDPIGEGVDTYGVLESGAALVIDPTVWAAINDATVQVNINNLGYRNCVFDFSAVVTMDQVAAVMQTEIRLYFPSATVTFLGEGTFPRLRITSGRVEGGNVAFCIQGLGGTPSLANLALGVGVATKTNPAVDLPFTVRNFNNPYVGRSTDRQWHWTHYVVYRTADYGPDGSHLKPNGKATVNSPDFIVWTKDLRVAGAFIARRWRGVIELQPGAEGGEFEKADERSVVEFEDGGRYEALTYIDNKHMRYRGTGKVYYNDDSPWMAAMIGNGRVARVVKNGTTISRYSGSQGTAFTQDDVRKPLWWPNGTYSYIRTVIDANTVVVWDDKNWIDRPYGTGVTLDPTYRNYRDIVSDEQLFGYSSGWTCKNRFFTDMKVADMISRQPGFILTAPRYGKEINYAQLELSYRQFLGYHNPQYQKTLIEDQILALEDFPNRYSAICEGSIFTGVTNNAVELTIPQTLQKIFQLDDPEKVADFGIMDSGSIRRIGEGLLRMVTNLDQIIDFDGINYGPDLAVDNKLGMKKIQKTVRAAYPQYCSIYSRLTGYIWWWKNGS
ncbi:MAG: DUF3383 domain-containing protein [bacterium]|nr:DUF3383 domain-containing protein [bacterium]